MKAYMKRQVYALYSANICVKLCCKKPAATKYVRLNYLVDMTCQFNNVAVYALFTHLKKHMESEKELR